MNMIEWVDTLSIIMTWIALGVGALGICFFLFACVHDLLHMFKERVGKIVTKGNYYTWVALYSGVTHYKKIEEYCTPLMDKSIREYYKTPHGKAFVEELVEENKKEKK